MTRATHYSQGLHGVLVALLGCGLCIGALAADTTNSPVPYLEQRLAEAQREQQEHPLDAERGWQLARACFDRAEFSTNSAQRAELAQQGIVAAQQALAQQSNSAPAHYYLAMNLGQLARTRSLGALRLVDKMEAEFHAARQLDERFDHAGPDRNLGRLYFQAPSIGSVGSRKKARLHLDKAAELAPDYPENWINLAEAALRWNQPGAARKELETLETKLADARQKFGGEAWAGAWLNWNARLESLRTALRKPGANPARAGGLR
jgi:tetratricopeptide (TPR) repeat protein